MLPRSCHSCAGFGCVNQCGDTLADPGAGICRLQSGWAARKRVEHGTNTDDRIGPDLCAGCRGSRCGGAGWVENWARGFGPGVQDRARRGAGHGPLFQHPAGGGLGPCAGADRHRTAARLWPKAERPRAQPRWPHRAGCSERRATGPRAAAGTDPAFGGAENLVVTGQIGEQPFSPAGRTIQAPAR